MNIKLSVTLDRMTTVKQSYAPSRLYLKLGILAAGLFVVGTNAFVIAGLLPSIGQSLHVSATDVSYSITFYAIVVAVVSPAISIAFPRVSRTTLMSLGLFLVCAGTVIAAVAPSVQAFTAGRVVAALGGAALVPTATAAAAALAPAERRGRAIAFVAVGFTAAVAFGAPLGTALAAAGGWRLPILGIAVLAALVGIAVAVGVRGVPIAAPVSVRRRFSILADPRITFALVATLLVIGGFNVVYIFSSVVTLRATGGSGSALALLLLVFGVSGIIGNLIAGPMTDRFGNRAMAALFIGAEVLALVALRFASGSFVATVVIFVVWGIAANAAALPIQHRLIAVDPATSGIALSWYSTAMYIGIALAPLVGAAALHVGGAASIPIFAAVAVALALGAFYLGFVRRDQRAAAIA
jgi:predicted MFS family arabinose efflux permease